MTKILVIDDEEMIVDSIKAVLDEMDCSVRATTDPAEGLALALASEYDLVLTDVRMPGLDGSRVVEGLLALKPAARILVMSAYPDDPLVVRALALGAAGLLKKPFSIPDILAFAGRGEAQ